MAKILIIEDCQAVRKSLERALNYRGHDCVTLGDGGELFDKIADPSFFDVVILDVQMRDFHGDAALAFLNFRSITNENGELDVVTGPPPPVIVITGFPEDPRTRWMKQFALVRAVIAKPFRMEQIEYAVLRVSEEKDILAMTA